MARTGPARAPLSERRDDLYETPIEATAALARAENLPPKIWEPCCGRGAIALPLRATGRTVIATDLVDYGCPDSLSRVDFLTEWRAPDGVRCIITNPPYKLADSFVRHALDLVPRVVMLLRLAFLESSRRSDLLEHRGLARVLVFRNRLPMMHRDGWSGPRSTSNTCFAWFCWDREHVGPPTIHRISWQRSDGGAP